MVIERALQPIEGAYALAVEQAMSEGNANNDTLQKIADFAYLQFFRTDVAAQRMLLAQEQIRTTVFKSEEERAANPPVSALESRQQAILIYYEKRQFISDLKKRIIVNDTDLNFFTSDDPSIHVNRFYVQKLRPPGQSAGLSKP